MPLYQYRNKETGEVIELLRSVEDRDQAPAGFERVTVPERVGIPRGLTSEAGASFKVPRALREIEQGSCGAREISKHFGMPVDTIKKAWAMT